MGKEHLNLLSELHRNLVLFGFGQIPRDVTCIFVLLAGDLARISVGAEFLFGRVDLADFFQGAIARCALARRAPVRIRVIPAELFERVAFGADILIILSVPFEVCACPGTVGRPALSISGM